jgi:hypothetical protein
MGRSWTSRTIWIFRDGQIIYLGTSLMHAYLLSGVSDFQGVAPVPLTHGF